MVILIYRLFSALRIEVCVERVHCLKELIAEYKRADNDERAEYIPAPEVTCAELAVKSAASELAAYSRAELVMPDEITYAEGKRTDNENEQPIVHGLLTVIAAAYNIGFFRDVGKNDKRVNAEGQC